MTEEQNTPPNIWNDFAARALRTGAPVPSVQIEFDAEMARLGLAWNFQNNRKPKQKNIENMVQAIREGTFTAGTVLRIAFDSLLNQWVLVDGQHRLAAVDASNTKQWFVVMVDSRPAETAYATLDRLGSMRTESDVVNGKLGWSVKHWSKIIGAFRLMYLEYNIYQSITGRISPAQLIEITSMIEEYKPTLMRIDQLPKGAMTSALLRSPSASVWIPAARYQPDIFFPWFEKAISDPEVTVGSIEMRVRELANIGATATEDRIKLSISSALVWKAKFEGKPMERMPLVQLTKNRKTQFPGIAGTPYAK
jgi:hypothetical protein